MGRRDDGQARRKLALKRETVRKLSLVDLARVAGGTWGEWTWDCETTTCDTTECWMSTGSRFC